MLHGLAEHIADAHMQAAEWKERSRHVATERERTSFVSGELGRT